VAERRRQVPSLGAQKLVGVERAELSRLLARRGMGPDPGMGPDRSGLQRSDIGFGLG
jgi:hypothetical protein